MTDAKFKVGDRVKHEYGTRPGTIRSLLMGYAISEGEPCAMVKFDDAPDESFAWCRYLSLLSDSPTLSETSMLNPVYQNAVLLRRQPEPKRVDQYKSEAHPSVAPTDAGIAALTDALPANQAARLRNIAALRAEFDISSEERWRRCTGPYHVVTGRPLR